MHSEVKTSQIYMPSINFIWQEIGPKIIHEILPRTPKCTNQTKKISAHIIYPPQTVKLTQNSQEYIKNT